MQCDKEDLDLDDAPETIPVSPISTAPSPTIAVVCESVPQSRATSWYDFLLEPAKLDYHINGLKNGTARNPSATDLIKIFLDNAPTVAATSGSQPSRSAILRSYAAKVAHEMELDLVTIENEILPKSHQHLLLDLLHRTYPESMEHEVNPHRWILRTHIRGPELPPNLGATAGLPVPVPYSFENIGAFLLPYCWIDLASRDSASIYEWLEKTSQKPRTPKLTMDIQNAIQDLGRHWDKLTSGSVAEVSEWIAKTSNQPKTLKSIALIQSTLCELVKYFLLNSRVEEAKKLNMPFNFRTTQLSELPSLLQICEPSAQRAPSAKKVLGTSHLKQVFPLLFPSTAASRLRNLRISIPQRGCVMRRNEQKNFEASHDDDELEAELERFNLRRKIFTDNNPCDAADKLLGKLPQAEHKEYHDYSEYRIKLFYQKGLHDNIKIFQSSKMSNMGGFSVSLSEIHSNLDPVKNPTYNPELFGKISSFESGWSCGGNNSIPRLELTLALYLNIELWENLCSFPFRRRDETLSARQTALISVGTSLAAIAIHLEGAPRLPKPFERIVYNVLNRISPVTYTAVENSTPWDCAHGLLSHLDNRKLLQSLVSLFGACALERKQKNRTTTTLETVDTHNIYSSGIVKQFSTSFFAQTSEEGTYLMFLQLTLRLKNLDRKPCDSSLLIHLGDAHYFSCLYHDAVRFYMLSEAMETAFFTTKDLKYKADSSMSYILPSLIECLVNLKAYTPAVILCQFHQKYLERALSILQSTSPALVALSDNWDYLQYIWEIPLLERFIYMYSHTHRDDTKLAILMKVVGHPDINDNNQREETINHLQSNFLQTLFNAFC
ncbi:integrator complex subunit 8 [Pelomyxa schiedti]|nr:integrator complex subunit 8 [Pelomyxa schiedti]